MTNAMATQHQSPLLLRARKSGKCPLTLIQGKLSVHDNQSKDTFDDAVLRVIEGNEINGGLAFRADKSSGRDFEQLFQMAENIDLLPATLDIQTKKQILEMRRCILLAIPGSTPPDNLALKYVLDNGYLFVVKKWLDDILNKSVGGVDLLLHLLSNIINLPVTKEMVSQSRLGKAVVAVEKHKICVGSKNENAIKERVAEIKQRWSASVKALKNGKKTEDKKSIPKNASNKRSHDSSNGSSLPSSSKKSRTDRNLLSTSNLIRKASSTGTEKSLLTSSSAKDQSGNKESALSAADKARLRAQERLQKNKARLAPPTLDAVMSDVSIPKTSEKTDVTVPKKKGKHITWADKAGKNLIEFHSRETTDEERRLLDSADSKKGGTSWSDRKKRERIHEKEMLNKARGKNPAMDEHQARLDAMGTTSPPLTPWHRPHALEIAEVQAISDELTKQLSRIATLTRHKYLSDNDVPNNPTPLSDIEVALDLTSQVSAIPASIPFFTAKEEILPAIISSLPVVPPQQSSQPIPPQQIPYPAAPGTGLLEMNLGLPPPPPPHTVLGQPFQQGATVEMVQALGLPTFLAGQNISALQTLASTPNLLNTFIDSNGMYDQVRLLSLVQTLAQNLTPDQQQQQNTGTTASMTAHDVTPGYMNQSYSASSNQQYNMSEFPVPAGGFHAPPPPPPPFQQQSQTSYVAPPQSNYNNNKTQNRQNGNKNGSNYRGDQNGSEGNLHLSGYGPTTTTAEIMQLFSPYVTVVEVVNKNGFSFVNTRDPSGARRAREALNGALLGGRPVRINIATRKAADPSHNDMKNKTKDSHEEATPLPRDSLGQIQYDKVRDDRGNPATKNLFVAGYGPGTTEQQLRDVFGQHAKVTGAVMKGSFAFINTTDRQSAVQARHALTGYMINGGVLRINFAKESGRLGTSFDTTYGPASSQSRYMKNGLR